MHVLSPTPSHVRAAEGYKSEILMFNVYWLIHLESESNDNFCHKYLPFSRIDVQ